MVGTSTYFHIFILYAHVFITFIKNIITMCDVCCRVMRYEYITEGFRQDILWFLYSFNENIKQLNAKIVFLILQNFTLNIIIA